jgi:hypothetical protein
MRLATYFKQALRDHELRAAIRARDLPRVKLALDAGANPNAGQFKDRDNQPLTIALHVGDAAIFRELLDRGASAGVDASPDFRLVKDVGSDFAKAEYHAPSYLYEAINLDKEDIALVLANDPKISPTFSGLVWPSTAAPKDKMLYEFDKTPYELAREKGMDRVAAALKEQTLPLLARREAEYAKGLNALAGALEERAAALRQQAQKITGTAPGPS